MENKVYYFELSDENHHKFYEIGIFHNRVKMAYGRIGSTGKIIEKTFPTQSKAIDFFKIQIKNKMKKGYCLSPKGITSPRRKGFYPGQLCFPFLLEIIM